MLLKCVVLLAGLATVGASTSCGCSGSSGDPHVSLAHGGMTDFRGMPERIYNFISSQNVSLNVRTVDADFKLHKVTVHGSFLSEAFLVARSRAGRLVKISYNASKLNEQGWSWTAGEMTCVAEDHVGPIVNGKHRFTLGPHQSADCDDVRAAVDVSTMTIVTDECVSRSDSTP